MWGGDRHRHDQRPPRLGFGNWQVTPLLWVMGNAKTRGCREANQAEHQGPQHRAAPNNRRADAEDVVRVPASSASWRDEPRG